MAEKPSLYVVEKKEVVILVIMFILVTVLAFTLGVKYGESVGRSAAVAQFDADKAHADAAADKVGGTLGAEGVEKPEAAPAPEVQAKSSEHEAKAHEEQSPEASAEAGKHSAETDNDKEESDAKLTNETAAAVDANSDKYLLEALRGAGVETPIEKNPAKQLPQTVKSVKAGDYVIQVGSYPTKRDAERQVNALRQKKLSASILPPFKDRQGEWYRVVLGNYKNRNSAEKDAKGLKSSGQIRSYFVKKLD